MTAVHPRIAAQRRRVIRTRFELYRDEMSDLALDLLRFAQAAGCDVGKRSRIMRALWLESVKLETAEAMALAEGA